MNKAPRQGASPQEAPPRAREVQHVGGRTVLVPWLYGCTIFLSAFLLFQVQPMIGKMVLPWLLGLFVLLAGTNGQALILGLFAVLWYNGVYTPLKKRTPFAAVPGALVGVIPPAIGWSSGGGHLFDPQLLAISFFFYIWQVPHFWILHFHFGRDYGKGGFPALTRIFTQTQFNSILFIWIFATGVASFFAPWFGILKSPLIIGGLFGIGGWLM